MKLVSVVHLITGQVVIGKLEAAEGDSAAPAILEAPYEILVAPTPKGLQVSLVPYGALFGVLNPFTELDLDVTPLLHQPREAPQQLIAEYTKITSGIILAPTGSVGSVPKPSHLEVVR